MAKGRRRPRGGGEAGMGKAGWGTEGPCPNWGARYYDLRHDPIVCPKCGAAFDPEALLKTRRVRVPVPVEPVAETAVEEEIDTELGGEEAEVEEGAEEVPVVEGEEVEDDDEEEEDEEEEEAEVIEDASELGEDEDDMAEVIENVEDEEER